MLSLGLMQAPPTGPSRRLEGAQSPAKVPSQPKQQAPHLLNRKRDQARRKVLSGSSRFFFDHFWMTARNACAARTRVRCRYQPVQDRTSYCSSPNLSLVSRKPVSIVQRRPAATASAASAVPIGANTIYAVIGWG